MSLGKILNFRNTLAFRLTLWYAGIFTLCSCVAFLLFYTLITSVIRERTDQELLSQARQLSTVLATRGLESGRGLCRPRGSGRRGEEGLLSPPLPERSGLCLDQHVLLEGYRRSRRRPSSELLRGGRHVFDTMVLRDRRDKVRVLYALTGPGIILAGGAVHGERFPVDRRIQGDVRDHHGLADRPWRQGSGGLWPGRAVSGVEAITRTAQNISGGSLEQRVPVKTTGDEIDQLATTFNQMLDRIERLVTESQGDERQHRPRSEEPDHPDPGPRRSDPHSGGGGPHWLERPGGLNYSG